MNSRVGKRDITLDRPQCPSCKEFITDEYREHHPYPEVPCPCCGTLVALPSAGQDEMLPENRRRDTRYPVALKVAYQSYKRFMVDYTVNVSRGGMFIRTRSAYEAGQTMSLSFHVPGLSEPVRLQGRVAHHTFGAAGEEGGIGVEFTDIDEASRDMLIAYAREQAHG